MENAAEATGSQIESVEKRKEELFARLKGVSNRLRYKIYEAKAVRAALEQKARETGVNARELRRRKERLEFTIATEATSIQKEREMMKEMKIIDKELDKAVEVEKLERKLRFVEGDVRSAEIEIDQIKKEIDGAKGEIKGLREQVKEKRSEERDKEWQEKKREQLMTRKEERDKEMKKEIEPFMGGLDDGVELGSIAVIKKKGQ